MEKKLKSIKIVTIISSIIMFICIIVLAFQFIKIGNLRHKSEELISYKSELVEQINNYTATNQYYGDRTEYLENYAREVLGWGLQNEHWYTTQN